MWQVGTVRETHSKSGALQPRRFYSVMAMAIKKTKLGGAVRKTAEIIEERLGALPPAKAKVSAEGHSQIRGQVFPPCA